MNVSASHSTSQSGVGRWLRLRGINNPLMNQNLTPPRLKHALEQSLILSVARRNSTTTDLSQFIISNELCR